MGVLGVGRIIASDLRPRMRLHWRVTSSSGSINRPVS
jgi:hypothetical protein